MATFVGGAKSSGEANDGTDGSATTARDYNAGMAIRQPSAPRAKPPTRPRWQSKYHGVRMTPEEYLALPEEKPYLEYVDGVVLQKPMPNEEHGRIAFRIGFLIQTWLGSTVATKAWAHHAGVQSYTSGPHPELRGVVENDSLWASRG